MSFTMNTPDNRKKDYGKRRSSNLQMFCTFAILKAVLNAKYQQTMEDQTTRTSLGVTRFCSISSGGISKFSL